MKAHTRRHPSFRRAILLITTLLASVAIFPKASAKTYSVKNLDDGGNGSLRSALKKLAESRDSSNTVTFKAGLNGIIKLTSPLPEIETSVSIVGPGANKVTVIAPNGGGFDFVSGVVSVSGLTIQGKGRDGSAIIRNQLAVLTIEECVLTSKGFSNQLGLFNEVGATSLVTSSAIVNNVSSSDGGGIRNGGTLTLINCTIGNNSADRGAAVFNEITGTTVLVNVTLADNSAEITGGGIFNDGGSVSLVNTIVARNVAGTPTTADDAKGVLASRGHNLVGSTVGSSGYDASDITNVTPENLGLAAAIAVNEGPTPSLALLEGSPAIDGGNDALALDSDETALAYDQRGAPFVRIAGLAVDIGAFESNIPAAPENAQAYKQRALMTISGRLRTADVRNRFYLRWAADRISASLESWLWNDGDHLSSNGFVVFLREQQAVWYLKKVTGTHAAAAQSAINDLVYADEKIAAAALNAASGAPGEDYARAVNAYNQGVAAAGSGNAFGAISWYSWTWWYSAKSLKRAVAYDDDANDYRYCDAD